jgi:hypothetical protein
MGWKPSSNLDRDFPLEHPKSEGSKKGHISTTEYTKQDPIGQPHTRIHRGRQVYTMCLMLGVCVHRCTNMYSSAS